MIGFSESKRGYSKKDGIWRPDPLSYHPIRKKKNFDPQPVAGNIPFYANVWKNPQCEGSSECNQFWEEQFNYCINGYETGGIWIPGRYYYYLNFTLIDGLFGLQYPWFLDLDLEYYIAVEWIKENKWVGIIAPKARRKGLSEKGVNNVNWGARFIPGYKAGIAAGISNYVDEFKEKIDKANKEVCPELKLSELTNNKTQIKFGYKIRNIYNKIEDQSSGVFEMATMYDDPKKLEGQYFHDVILEESGEFPLLKSVIESIKPALMMGSEMLGSFFIYGTGGNILSSSKGFKALYDDAENQKLLRFEVAGQRMCYPFIGLTNKVKERHAKKRLSPLNESMPSFDAKNWKSYERVGCEDTWKADEWIVSETEKYRERGNIKDLREFQQNYPRTVEDIFTSAGKNNFNADVLYYALNTTAQEEKIYKPYILSFKKIKDAYGMPVIKQPLEVDCRPAKPSDPEWQKVWIWQMPTKIKNTDFGGVDAYEMDEKSETTNSLGAVCVLRDFRFHQERPIAEPALLPVCYYYDRPPRKEKFFEISLMISVFYGLQRKMMVSAEHESCLDFFQVHGGRKFLAFRPKSMDSPKSQQIHKYGVKMTPYSKPRMLGLSQSYIDNWGIYLRCDPLIRDYLAYDEENIGTDWDLTDATGNALICRHDQHTVLPREEDEKGVDNDDSMEYYYDENGNFTMKSTAIKKSISKKVKVREEGQPDYMIC